MARRRFPKRMPPRIQRLYDKLWPDVVHVHFKWTDFLLLFGSKDNVDLLNSVSADFFGRVENALRDDVFVHICRITDKVKVAGKDTLTIRRFADVAPGTPGLATALARSLAHTRKIRSWRNRRLAHREHHARMLPAVQRHTVDAALKSIAGVMQLIALHYGDIHASFDTEGCISGTPRLLYHLRRLPLDTRGRPRPAGPEPEPTG